MLLKAPPRNKPVRPWTEQGFDGCKPPQPTNLLKHHAFANCEGFFLCQLGHIWTQHLAQSFSQQPVIFTDSMSVNSKRKS